MPEAIVNQAAGLMGIRVSAGSQLIPVVTHGDELAELPLLWRLCGSLVEMGYLVTVLDATQPETDDNPGLEHMLEYRAGRRGSDVEAPEWSVVPAGIGIQSLCGQKNSKAECLHRLSQLFPANSVIILFANANTLTALLGDSQAKPLLAISSAKRALLSSYIALKRLLIGGKLDPLILNMISKQPHALNRISDPMLNLSECAKNFLDYDLNAINIHLSPSEETLSAEVRQVALCLLDAAVPLWSDETLMTQSNRSH